MIEEDQKHARLRIARENRALRERIVELERDARSLYEPEFRALRERMQTLERDARAIFAPEINALNARISLLEADADIELKARIAALKMELAYARENYQCRLADERLKRLQEIRKLTRRYEEALKRARAEAFLAKQEATINQRKERGAKDDRDRRRREASAT